MSSRNKIEANTYIFKRLDEFCAQRQQPVDNAGEPRWISSEPGFDRNFLENSVSRSKIAFGAATLACFEHNSSLFFCTVGFEIIEYAPELDELSEISLTGGVLTTLIYELKPDPLRSAAEIRNIVGFSSNYSPDYEGHASEDIAALFPNIQCYEVVDLDAEEISRVFFLFCLAQAERSNSWMNDRLRETLHLIARLSPVAIPYRTLCRSLLDADPGSVFLALYRCLEALYAYSHSTKLIEKLGVNKSWDIVAQDLESTLGWRPREEPSLEALLHKTVDFDLEAIVKSLGEKLPEGANLVSVASNRVYQLRNNLVHYRPFHHHFEIDGVDWNKLCEAMAAIVLDVYEAVGPRG